MDSDKPAPEETLEESAELLQAIHAKRPKYVRGHLLLALVSLDKRVARIAKPLPVTNASGSNEKN